MPTVEDRDGKGTFKSALAHRDFRLLLSGLGVSYVGDWMYGVAIVAYVYQETRSAAVVAASGFLRMVPYLLFGTLGGVLADRYERRGVMIASDLSRALLMFGLAAVAAASGPVAVAIAIVMLSAAVATPYHPALAAMTPEMVGEHDLAAANSAMSVIENIGLALGPALGGMLLLLGSPALAFALNGVTFLASLACVAATMTRSRASEESQHQAFWARFRAGFAAVRGSPDVALMLAVIVVSTVLYGQENVLLVLVSNELLGTGTDGVAFLFAAIGVGGLAGAAVSSRAAEDPRPGRFLMLTLCLSGASLMGLAFTRVPLVAYGFMTLDGAGAVVLDVLAITMLQRTVPSDVMARVFGILITLSIVGTLLGSLVAPVMLNLFGLRPAVLAAGALLPLTGLLIAPRLRALNRRAERASIELGPSLELLEGLPVFRGAAPGALEALASSVEALDVAAGETVVHEGDPADDFYVVRSGTLDVLSSGEAGGPARLVNRLGKRDYFGEIGLLERIPRTATVRASTACELYRIDGDEFLRAVGQAPTIAAALRSGLAGRLARTHPSYAAAAPAHGAT